MVLAKHIKQQGLANQWECSCKLVFQPLL